MMKSIAAYKSDQIEERIYRLAHHIDHVSLNGSSENFSSFVESATLKQSDFIRGKEVATLLTAGASFYSIK